MGPETLPAESAPNWQTLPAEAAALVRAYQTASKADSTVRAYRSDVQVFQAWCARFGFRSLPASPEAVTGFLAAEAEAGRSSSTIGRRLAAIRHGHKLAKAADPTYDEDVRATKNGIRRRVGTAPTHKATPTVDVLQIVLARTQDHLTGKRERDLLALGYAGAFSRA
ncbi:site-specific integrase, partial [Methylobacterium sp. E-046]|uniref:site-specific integrase n=1 Tax=Methylobacterium sp. E-046 TaxID=2836576 RepID=UPI001FBAE06C